MFVGHGMGRLGRCVLRQWKWCVILSLVGCSVVTVVFEVIHTARIDGTGLHTKANHGRNATTEWRRASNYDQLLDKPMGRRARDQVIVMKQTWRPGEDLKQRFDKGEWNSSTVARQYHLHLPVNCSGLILGDPVDTLDASEALSRVDAEGKLAIPTDEAVTAWTRNCAYYRSARRFPWAARSREELDYPLAYILLVHKDSALVERLLRSVYQPQNVYCIHVDANAAEDFWLAIRGLVRCFRNVFIASKLEAVQYRGFSRLQADINCMEDLISPEFQWHYVINLCGQDFPLKTNLEIVRQVKAYKGHNDIPGVFPKQTNLFIGRTANHHKVVNGELKITAIKKPPIPHNAKIYFGNAYYVASREFVQFILYNETAQDILYYLEDSNSPDEHYWITMSRYPGVPGGYPYSSWNSVTRFIRWTTSNEHPPCIGKYVRNVCVIGSGYLPYVTSVPHLFVNKVYYDYDPIAIQCIEEMLDYRTEYPDAIHDFVKDYPRTNLFPSNVTADKLPFQ